jgi:thiamine-monophosphate kinase
MLIEDVHFRRATHSARDTGYKALARGLSDIAAMGGAPRFCLLSLAVPRWADRAWVDGFYSGFLNLAERAATPLAGGDLARAEKMACDVTVCGAVPRDAALLRSGARPGDAIFVSGKLGGAALGLAHAGGRGWRRHVRPEPRLALGQFLRQRLGATAAMDLSDGLSLDLTRMCAASKVSASIGAPPVFPGASIDQALHGGEDYELLFTLPPDTHPPADFEGLRLTRIGTITKRRATAVLLDGKPLPPLGFDHFHNA